MTYIERNCQSCGNRLVGRDQDRDTCRECRSPEGKIADLDIAIRASGDDPSRIDGWSEIRYWLEKRFAPANQEVAVELLWRRFKDWARFVKKIREENEWLGTPLTQLLAWLEHEFETIGYSAADFSAGRLTPEVERNFQQAEKAKPLPSEELLMKLPKPLGKAILAFRYAEKEWERELEINEAWELLWEHGINNEEKLKDYELPSKKTFADYVSKARGRIGQTRYQRRAGRTGRSIVPKSDA